MAFEWYFEYYLNITMTVAKMGDIQIYVVRVISLLLGCYSDVTQMVFLCWWIIYMYNTSYISYDISIIIDILYQYMIWLRWSHPHHRIKTEVHVHRPASRAQ